MNIMEPIWTKIFIDQTYSSIKNRGIHKVEYDLSKVLKKRPRRNQILLKNGYKEILSFYNP